MRYYIYISVLVLVLSNSCKHDVGPKGFPEVTTSSYLNITTEGVEVSAEIQSEGFFEVFDHGFVFSTKGGVDNEEDFNRVSLGSFSGGGKFSAIIDRNLIGGRSYVVKAYVKTKNQTIYGNPVDFISKGAKAPIIKRLSDSLYVGDTITIWGKYFADQNGENRIDVPYDIDRLHPVYSSDTLLKVIVPELSFLVWGEYRHIPLEVVVAGKISNNIRFSLGVPIVYSINPEKALPGETIKIKGKGLAMVRNVVIDNISNYINVLSDSVAEFTLSNDIKSGNKVMKLYYSYSSHQGGGHDLTIKQQIQILFPEIRSVSPLTASVDSILTVRGTHLDKLQDLSVNSQVMQNVLVTDSLVKIKINHVFSDGPIRATFFNNDVISSQIVKFKPPG